MSGEHILYESSGHDNIDLVEKLAKFWSKGTGLDGGKFHHGPEYNTVLKTKNGQYYVTNRFDPKVVQWCKDNNVVPEDK